MQGIFVRYKRKNLYKIYHPLTRKIYKTQNIDIDKRLLYNKLEANSKGLANRKSSRFSYSVFANSYEFVSNLLYNNFLFI